MTFEAWQASHRNPSTCSHEPDTCEKAAWNAALQSAMRELCLGCRYEIPTELWNDEVWHYIKPEKSWYFGRCRAEAMKWLWVKEDAETVEPGSGGER